MISNPRITSDNNIDLVEEKLQQSTELIKTPIEIKQFTVT